MDFASPRSFVMDKHWAYYADLSLRAKLSIFHRATKPHSGRIPSDIWYRVEGYLIPLAMIVQVPFCFAFPGAWNFRFPSHSEQVMWRAASVFHALYSSLGTAYYFFTLVPRTARKSKKTGDFCTSDSDVCQDPSSSGKGAAKLASTVGGKHAKLVGRQRPRHGHVAPLDDEYIFSHSSLYILPSLFLCGGCCFLEISAWRCLRSYQ